MAGDRRPQARGRTPCAADAQLIVNGHIALACGDIAYGRGIIPRGRVVT
jgi:hypothetical protein